MREAPSLPSRSPSGWPPALASLTPPRRRGALAALLPGWLPARAGLLGAWRRENNCSQLASAKGYKYFQRTTT